MVKRHANRMETRVCRTCGVAVPVDGFYLKNGKPTSRQCKACTKKAQREKSARLRQRDPATAVTKTEKTCNSCGETKPVADFFINLSNPDALTALCKQCTLQKNEEFERANPQSRALRAKRWRKKNPERAAELGKAWREANPEKFKQMTHEVYMRWSRTEKGKATIRRRVDRHREEGRRASYSAARRTAEMNATPTWVDMQAVFEIYSEAAALSARDGEQWHVDHIDPLRNDLVCGLHVPQNLVPTPGLENLRKNNTFKPYRIDADGNRYELSGEEWLIIN